MIYVIAIAKVTHQLSIEFTLEGLRNYIYLFGIIFWSWLNGSIFYDNYRNSGLRPKFMILFQILIVVAITLSLESPKENLKLYTTITFMAMQLYVTYMWWSIKYYNRSEKENYTSYVVCYIISFFILLISLLFDNSVRYILILSTLIFNYLPPFILYLQNKRKNITCNISENMSDRLGFFAIIVYGELILGVINGISSKTDLSFDDWLHFGLAIVLVLSLWWIFFTVISAQKTNSNFLNSSILELLYIPNLMALSILSISFSTMLSSVVSTDPAHGLSLLKAIPIAISVYFFTLSFVLFCIHFKENLESQKKKVQRVFLIASALLMILAIIPFQLTFFTLLGIYNYCYFCCNIKSK